jgi:NAD(P)-dependent dehydrogenase (short-subunit alcohol dehydrogenase family)
MIQRRPINLISLGCATAPSLGSWSTASPGPAPSFRAYTQSPVPAGRSPHHPPAGESAAGGCVYTKAGHGLPLGRVGEPEDLAETYLYLMRERFSIGAMVVIDGGSTLV